MKKLTAYFKPFRLEAVLEALPSEGVVEVHVAEARGYGRQKGHLELYKPHVHELTFLPKAKLEIYCEDEGVDKLRETLITAARTGRIGDGKLLISDVEHFEEF